jgi:hypothetical protein
MCLKPNGRITPDIHSWGEPGYFENESLSLNISFVPSMNAIEIYYYGDDDSTYRFETMLDDTTTITDIRKLFKECFDVSLTTFLNKEKKLIEEIVNSQE